MSSVKARSPAEPRLSASLVVINETDHVLLVQRAFSSGSFPGVHVFPGGHFDPSQDASVELTAIRETFEETGLLLGMDGEPALDNTALNSARKDLYTGKIAFPALLNECNVHPIPDKLLPFTQWITPASAPRRFHTHFFVTFLSEVDDGARPAAAAQGVHEQRMPTPDGGLEVFSTRFLRPSVVLEQFRRKEIALMPPQFYILSVLADIFAAQNRSREQQHASIRQLSAGPFGRAVFNPLALPKRDNQAPTIMTYESDEERGGPKGRRHRSVIKFGPSGVSSEMSLERNFDIFTEFFETPSTPGQLPIAKL
ncbi:hypothetical protein PUNSTDRAFT_135790 [Punctularia strigosozonata HHB-11173 SS5]|uniref:uncharacterized protein n=1 Tax=Punctularia strigosozonata (strain HHB-11173) TaxID=741275 RepID=UPI0004418609|nr:uncharacterized protein PUNSTDRAFT_135790 [Punctularia strigosozonata HHB-11173 SS5]EIN07101.1 hypothetical protein PUNSTDRAFT_135790 [Punctularia strigosozonata HHB-11173 SS5]